ncbi:serine/threonine-protein kinase pakD [Drosophila obscura]|uniref:serine/threonine-protein kinase pakD n=1 Tax=Drosophila obscura TaxID=7282 RepID=UPI001BB12ACB|nr:serine/threonine-protein kinase pakD [Drosophila obscura]
MPQWLVIGISGVTCGGKTTLAHSLHEYFKGLSGAPLWNSPYTIGDVQLISQDDYFLPVEDRRHTRNEALKVINFELLTSLDMSKMLNDIAQIIKGRHLAPEPAEQLVTYANFEHYALQFQQQYRQHHYNANYYKQGGAASGAYQYVPQQQQQRQHHHQQIHHQQQQQQQQQLQQQQQHAAHIMRLNAQIAAQLRDKKINFLLVEGFMIFNQPELLALCNIKYHFHLPYEKCFERRRKRTYDPPDVTGYFELCVWPHYEKNFSEYRDCKDITFLNGEISRDKIFKYVLQRIVHYFEERCDVPAAAPPACPPQQKRFGMLYVGGTSNNNVLPTACPMEQ